MTQSNNPDDPSYLLNQQYRTATNLKARIALHERFGTNPFAWQRWVFDQLALGDTANVLELGCGPGTFWRENLDRIPAKWDVVLSDFSAGMVETSQAALSILPNFHFQQFDAQAIPFPDASFDAVIANHMIYHIPDKPKALAEIRRVLRPGGKLYAATNGSAHLQELHDLSEKVDFEPVRFAPSFTLENGVAQLQPFFANITLQTYKNELAVTEVEPVVDYLASYNDFLPEQAEQVRTLVAEQISKAGRFVIRNSTGLFIAGNA